MKGVCFDMDTVINLAAAAISVGSAVAAFLSRTETQKIKNNLALTLREKDEQRQQYEETVLHKRTVIENYIKYSGRCVLLQTMEAKADYGGYHYLAMPYVPTDFLPLMQRVNNAIYDDGWQDAVSLLDELIPRMQEILKTL